MKIKKNPNIILIFIEIKIKDNMFFVFFIVKKTIFRIVSEKFDFYFLV